MKHTLCIATGDPRLRQEMVRLLRLLGRRTQTALWGTEKLLKEATPLLYLDPGSAGLSLSGQIRTVGAVYLETVAEREKSGVRLITPLSGKEGIGTGAIAARCRELYEAGSKRFLLIDSPPFQSSRDYVALLSAIRRELPEEACRETVWDPWQEEIPYADVYLTDSYNRNALLGILPRSGGIAVRIGGGERDIYTPLPVCEQGFFVPTEKGQRDLMRCISAWLHDESCLRAMRFWAKQTAAHISWKDATEALLKEE